MTGLVKTSIVVISVLMAVIVVTGCSSRFVPLEETEASLPSGSPESSSHLVPTNGIAQSNTAGRVTIEVKWMGVDNGLLTFAVAMNTHSVDLDSYDLGELAVLRDDTGREYHPASWDSAPGGHHRQGTLIFSIPDPLVQGEAKYLELFIRDVAMVNERILKWELD